MKVCKPLDLKFIRESLRGGNVTLKQMGEIIPSYVPACPYCAVPESRVQDWELGRRSVPEYVYYAYAALVADDWACDRHQVAESTLMDIDYRYGSMLNEGFGELLKLEHLIEQSSDPAHRVILPCLALQRNCWKRHFMDLFGLNMEHVWAEELDDLFQNLRLGHKRYG